MKTATLPYGCTQTRIAGGTATYDPFEESPFPTPSGDAAQTIDYVKEFVLKEYPSISILDCSLHISENHE